MKEKIISDLYNNKELKRRVNKLCGKRKIIADELFSEIFVRLLSKSDEYIFQHHQRGTLVAAATVIARNILFQKNSEFEKTVLKPYFKKARNLYSGEERETDLLEEIPEEQEDNVMNDLSKALNEELPKIHYHRKYLITELLRQSKFDDNKGKWKHATIKQISENPTRYRYNTESINKAKDELRERITENLKSKRHV
ncbi:MAG: hypothetical protein J0H29_21050 [Sphingobacteriales bacterium]|nr:hypothetical protein [Sphingobacteriales bacterium]OJY86365.1 MAG: hypothetical protein BGP14_20535 [Sphingobacteriales bacterium 44-15]